jgi:hypothetical protein
MIEKFGVAHPKQHPHSAAALLATHIPYCSELLTKSKLIQGTVNCRPDTMLANQNSTVAAMGTLRLAENTLQL